MLTNKNGSAYSTLMALARYYYPCTKVEVSSHRQKNMNKTEWAGISSLIRLYENKDSIFQTSIVFDSLYKKAFIGKRL